METAPGKASCPHWQQWFSAILDKHKHVAQPTHKAVTRPAPAICELLPQRHPPHRPAAAWLLHCRTSEISAAAVTWPRAESGTHHQVRTSQPDEPTWPKETRRELPPLP